MDITCEIEETGDVTLVECVIASTDDHHRRVRVTNLLAGPVWPPRRRGRAADGWRADDRPDEEASGGARGGAASSHDDTEATFEGILAPGETLSLGYASPAPPREPPVDVSTVSTGPTVTDTVPTAVDVLAEWGDPAPPRDAVPVDAGVPTDGTADRDVTDDGPSPGGGEGVACDEAASVRTTEPRTAGPAAEALPAAVAGWLDAVERRLASDSLHRADRRALDALGRRTAALRGAVDDDPSGIAAPSPPATTGSRR